MLRKVLQLLSGTQELGFKPISSLYPPHTLCSVPLATWLFHKHTKLTPIHPSGVFPRLELAHRPFHRLLQVSIQMLLRNSDLTPSSKIVTLQPLSLLYYYYYYFNNTSLPEFMLYICMYSCFSIIPLTPSPNTHQNLSSSRAGINSLFRGCIFRALTRTGWDIRKAPNKCLIYPFIKPRSLSDFRAIFVVSQYMIQFQKNLEKSYWAKEENNA